MTAVPPGIGVFASYRRAWFARDLLAGITVWAMLVPQSLGFSSLAGLPPVVGLYAGLGAMVLYWLWGSCRELNVGAESTVAILVATIVSARASAGSDEYVEIAAMLAILVGLILVLGGLLRLGRIADFLSRPVLAGYVFGSGILIIGSQLPDLFGTDTDTDLDITDLESVARRLDSIDLTSVVFGVTTIAVVVALKRLTPAVPGALVAVVGSALVVGMFNVDPVTVGAFPSGIPTPGAPDVSLSDVVTLLGPAFAIALLVYPDSVLTAQSLGRVNVYRVDANREFFGIGAANVGAGLVGAFPVNGSQSRSFVLSGAGARTQVANLWAAAFVVLTLLFLAPAFDYLPTATLAGIVIVAGAALLDPSEFVELWKFRRTELALALITTASVLGLGMLVGIVIAVGLSLLVVVLRAASPHTAVLGRMPGSDTYRDVADHPHATIVPGLLLFRFDAPLFFANSAALRDQVTDLVDRSDPPISRVVLDAESIHDVDSTGAQVLGELLDDLERRGVEMVMARVRTEIRDELALAGIDTRLAADGVYLEVDDAVRAYADERT